MVDWITIERTSNPIPQTVGKAAGPHPQWKKDLDTDCIYLQDRITMRRTRLFKDTPAGLGLCAEAWNKGDVFAGGGF